jgi:hypothetical protein
LCEVPFSASASCQLTLGEESRSVRAASRRAPWGSQKRLAEDSRLGVWQGQQSSTAVDMDICYCANLDAFLLHSFHSRAPKVHLCVLQERTPQECAELGRELGALKKIYRPALQLDVTFRRGQAELFSDSRHWRIARARNPCGPGPPAKKPKFENLSLPSSCL